MGEDERTGAGRPKLAVGPKDQRLAQLEAEIAELVAACLDDHLRRHKEKEGVAIRQDEPR